MNKFRKKALFASPLLLLVIIILFFYKKSDEDMDPQFSRADTDDSQTNELFETQSENDDIAIVDIKGEVKKPGIYEVNQDERVDDVLQLAGGLTSKADELSVNLAEKVYDEMVIIVPEEGEVTAETDGLSSGNKIRINHAEQEEVESLPGIGPSKAEAIIQYRKENGPFKQVEDLLEISGIGEKTLENFKNDIRVP